MKNTIALYIHIPFCKQKCMYCDFPSFSCKDSYMFNYTEALCKELLTHKNKNIGSIFVGGGTPTYLSLSCLEFIGKAIAELRLTENAEFTVEGNPDSLTKEKLILFKKIGVNRLSIGLQAWQESLLKGLGRIHDIQQFIKAYNDSRSLGFNNINVDIMFGLPNQNLEMWKETLWKVAELNPEHISAYGLIVEEDTPFYKLHQNDALILPSEDIEREMYHYCIEFLEKKGFIQYEISNFSKEGFQCRHNLTYWNLGEYIGCGSAAHSYKDNYRYKNTSNIEKYIKDINVKLNACEEKIHNSKEDTIEEFMFMGLRKIKGISLKEFKAIFNIDIFSIYSSVIDKYIKNNLLILENDHLHLSPRGIELSNQVMCEFLIK